MVFPTRGRSLAFWSVAAFALADRVGLATTPTLRSLICQQRATLQFGGRGTARAALIPRVITPAPPSSGSFRHSEMSCVSPDGKKQRKIDDSTPHGRYWVTRSLTF